MAKYFLTNNAVQDLSEIYEYTYSFWPEKQAENIILSSLIFAGC